MVRAGVRRSVGDAGADPHGVPVPGRGEEGPRDAREPALSPGHLLRQHESQGRASAAQRGGRAHGGVPERSAAAERGQKLRSRGGGLQGLRSGGDGLHLARDAALRVRASGLRRAYGGRPGRAHLVRGR
ncbi:hypothetical protein ON010_g859 [Phytophthora cinnamomi]|nr:hypothetical protein ON010_g859 [Phytophthora cinnamomi]